MDYKKFTSFCFLMNKKWVEDNQRDNSTKTTKLHCSVVQKFTSYQYIYIYIYITEAFELSTIFHVSIFFKFLNLIYFFFLNIYTLLSQTKISSRYTSETKRRTAEPKATVQGQNGRTSPFDKTKPSTSPFDITHQT